MKDLGLKQDDLCYPLGVKTRGAVGNYLSGRRTPDHMQFFRLANFLGLTVEQMMGGSVTAAPRGKVPLISWIQAGTWSSVGDAYELRDKGKWVYTTKAVGPTAFALRVVGDSMVNPGGVPTYPPGTIIIVDPGRRPENGSRIIAQIGDGSEATFKQLVIDAGRQYLKPMNPRYPMIDFPDKAEVIGVVVQSFFDEDQI